MHSALMCMFFISVHLHYLHHHGVPGLISSSFSGPPSGLAAIVHCVGKQQL